MNFDYKIKPGKSINKDNICINYDKPIISIITAYYNGDKHIEETMNSILNQTFAHWEWIIVDDGSKKESLDKLNKILVDDCRIKVYSINNSGPSAARDFSFSKMSKSSEYVFILDDDDLIENNYLEMAYWTLQINKDASWAYGDCVNFGITEHLWQKKFNVKRIKSNNFLVATALIRKEALLKVGGYNRKEKAINEDWILWLKLLSQGMYPVRMPVPLFWYRKKVANESELARSLSNIEKTKQIIKEDVGEIDPKLKAIEFPLNDFNWEIIPDNLDVYNIKPSILKKSNKTKLLVIVPWITMGGADKFNIDFINALDDKKFDIIIMTTLPSINEWKYMVKGKATIYELPNFLSKKDWPLFVDTIIKSNNIDVIISTNSTAGYAMIPYLKVNNPNVPIIDYIHMEEWYNRNGGFSRDTANLKELIDMTYVCNQNSENILINHFGKDKDTVETVYIGVDEKKFDPSLVNKEEKEKFINDFKIPTDKKIISFIARIDLQKRPHLLMKIIKKTLETRNDVVFVIAGDGPMLNDIKYSAYKYGVSNNVIFLGRILNTKLVYAISDMTLNCSIKEGLALTSYESLSMGVPVVSSDVGGQQELINKDTGVIVPCMQDEKDVSNFNYIEEEIKLYVDGIDKVLGELNRYKKNCRKRIIEGFTIDSMTKKMANIILNTAKNPNKKVIENAKSLEKVKSLTKEVYIKDTVIFNNDYVYLTNLFNAKFSEDYSGKRTLGRKVKDKFAKYKIYKIIVSKLKRTNLYKKFKNK